MRSYYLTKFKTLFRVDLISGYISLDGFNGFESKPLSLLFLINHALKIIQDILLVILLLLDHDFDLK